VLLTFLLDFHLYSVKCCNCLLFKRKKLSIHIHVHLELSILLGPLTFFSYLIQFSCGSMLLEFIFIILYRWQSSGSGSCSGRSGRISLTKKNCQVTSRVRVDSVTDRVWVDSVMDRVQVDLVRVESGFRSNTIGFFGSRVISDRVGSGFGFL
jgi:hypothetical protein